MVQPIQPIAPLLILNDQDSIDDFASSISGRDSSYKVTDEPVIGDVNLKLRSLARKYDLSPNSLTPSTLTIDDKSPRELDEDKYADKKDLLAELEEELY